MKDEVRRRLKAERENFTGVQRENADELIAQSFLAAYSRYNSFFIYNGFGAEAGTKGIIEGLLSLNKQIYLPRVEGKSIVAVPFGQTRKGAFGISEPTGQAFLGDIDVVVIPLVAVNGRGYRIGYGKGYYDRYLKNSKAHRVGLGYSFQIEDFKEDEWDERLDEFLCERGIYYFG